MRLKASKHIFIDGTFHHPPDFYQMLIIMYKDIITDLKIPALYILLNSKREILYEIVFQSVINNILQETVSNLKYETIVTDQEVGLINATKKYFPNCQRISCLFHYKQDILRNLKSYGLYKKKYKTDSDIILNKLGKLPFIFKGNMEIFDKECRDIKENYPIYTNFIENYFIINKKIYFQDGSLNYFKVPKDCRTNNYLENYNGYIKSKLGKHRLTNWVNFLNFIKEESKRNIDKLYNAASNHLKNMQFKEQLNITNPFINIIKDNKIEVTFDNMNNNNSNDIENFHEKNKQNNFDCLTNLGLTCYMNSSLQIMMHTDIIIEKIIQFKNPFIDNLTNQFIDLVVDIISIEFNNKNEYIY